MLTNLEKEFLEELKREGRKVTIFIANGYQMRGVVIDFDENIVKFKQETGNERKIMVIYKRAISTISEEERREGPKNFWNKERHRENFQKSGNK